MKFTDSHEWVKVDQKVATVGISKFAKEELGEIVHVELPEVGATVQANQEIVVLESTKAACDLYAPLSGKITSVNTSLGENPDLMNQSPEDKGWLFTIEMSHPEELEKLMDREAYLAQF